MSDRVIRDGRVAVLVSPGYGAGWSSWSDVSGLMFCPEIVAWVEAGKVGGKDAAEAIVKQVYPDVRVYCGGAEQLEVHWLAVGGQFRIEEYDGFESIAHGDSYWVTA